MKVRLTNAQWQKILPFLRTCPNIYIGQEKECRQFLEAVLWIARSGAQWRLLPEGYGNWNTLYERFARWSAQNVFEKLFEFCASSDRDFEHLLIDSTIVERIRQRRAQKKHGHQSLGRSRGGFSTKIHLAVDALGNALKFILSGGEVSDHRKAHSLIADLRFDYLIADKGYDSRAFVETVERTGAKTVIPSRSYNRYQRRYDKHIYRERHLIECFIGKIKHYRRIFTRFEKLSKNYLSFIQLVSSLIWLR